MAEKKKEVRPRTSVGDTEVYMSPTAKKIAAKVRSGEMTTKEGIDAIAPKDASPAIRTGIAKALGRQEGFSRATEITQSVNQAIDNPSKTQTRKPSFSKGGMVTKANCGASMKPTQKKAK
jgi:hypothetical protein